VNANAKMKVNAANATKRGANANAKGAKALVNKNAKKIVNAANAIKTAVVGTAKAVQGSFNDRMKIKRNSLTTALAKLGQLKNEERTNYVSQVTLNGNINTILTEARKVDRKRLNNKLLIAKKAGNLNTIKKLQKIKQNTIEAATNAMKKKKELLNKRKKNTNRPGGGGPPPGPGGGGPPPGPGGGGPPPGPGGGTNNNARPNTKQRKKRFPKLIFPMKTKMQVKPLIKKATNEKKKG